MTSFTASRFFAMSFVFVIVVIAIAISERTSIGIRNARNSMNLSRSINLGTDIEPFKRRNEPIKFKVVIKIRRSLFEAVIFVLSKGR